MANSEQAPDCSMYVAPDVKEKMIEAIRYDLRKYLVRAVFIGIFAMATACLCGYFWGPVFSALTGVVGGTVVGKFMQKFINTLDSMSLFERAVASIDKDAKGQAVQQAETAGERLVLH